jgi:hypothetical protein
MSGLDQRIEKFQALLDAPKCWERHAASLQIYKQPRCWLLDNAQYTEWCDKRCGLLWCHSKRKCQIDDNIISLIFL